MSIRKGNQIIAGVVKQPKVEIEYAPFSEVTTDHVLTYEESKGFAKQGDYVYSESAPSRYGYPGFVNKVFQEYEESTSSQVYAGHNAYIEGDVVDNGNGVLSRFWLQGSYGVINTKNPTSSFELVAKCYTPVLLADSALFYPVVGYKGVVFRCTNASTGQMNMYVGNGSSWFINNVNTNCPISANTWTWFKVKWDGTTYTVSKSTDGVNYTQGYSVANATAPNMDGTPHSLGGTQGLGGTSVASNAWQYGSIDLKECYLDIDGERYWSGANFVDIRTHENGHKFYDIADKPLIDAIYDKTKDAWFYGVDKENNRVFMPRRAERRLIKSAKDLDNLGSWYNLYSDGWCEQGGKIGTVDANWRTREINLLIPYKDVNYTVHVNTGNTAHADEPCLGANKTPSSFECFPHNAGGNANWSARGYTNQIDDSIKHYIVVGNTEGEVSSVNATDITTSENDTIPMGQCVHINGGTQPSPAWLVADGMFRNGAMYPSFYQYLVNNVDNTHIIDFANIVEGTDYTKCFIVNQDNMTFKLPIRTEERRLVYEYSNGTEWVNLYSDGWCEQGGRATISSYYANITFLKQFVDTNYNIEFTQNGVNEDTYCANVEGFTNSTMRLRFRGGGTFCFWQASGYADIPQPNEWNTDDKLYFKVGNALQNLQMVDVGLLMSFLKTLQVVDQYDPSTAESGVFYFERSH